MPDFTSEYQKLNPHQKQAVDTIDGPVMVIAGAGTGKTQTIALRIANILDKTDVGPSSILCLTYTDVAANNMRSRLVTLIGSSAYKVKICTFHSFCNDVISANSEYFSSSSELRPLDDLENIQIIRQLIDQLPNSSPLITWGDRYFYQKDLLDNLRQVKRENISPETLTQLIDDQQHFFTHAQKIIDRLSQVRATKNNYSQITVLIKQLIDITDLSANIKGHLQVLANSSDNLSEVKAKIKKFHQDLEKNIPKQTEFVRVYQQYQAELKARSLYDYEDMILFVINAFKQSPDLLLTYQEKYQYLLVDEYQDTNSSQNQLLDLLGSYYDRPNLFVVGDDDQSIFRFQGASVENILHFHRKYYPETIVLTNNYRSHKLILDSSSSVISHNQNRIANHLTDIDKTLVPSVDYDPNPINLAVLDSPLEEDYFISQKIKTLLESGENPSEIAVLFRKNKDPRDLVNLLSAQNINYYLPSDTDILKNPVVIQIIHLLEFIVDLHDSEALYHLLNAPFIRLRSLDLLKIVKQSAPLSESLFTSLKSSELSLSSLSQKRLTRLGQKIARTRKDLANYPLEKVFNRLLKRFRIIKYLLSRHDIDTLNQVHSFYAFLKETVIKKDLDLPQFLDYVRLYIDNHLPLPSLSLSFDSQDSVKLLTVHGAKGLEFNHVFIYHLLEDSWEKQRNLSKLRLPFGLLSTEVTRTIEDDYEEERRLFYVALTRAKKQLYLSYSRNKDNGKSQNPSLFISEIDPSLIESVNFHGRQEALNLYYGSRSSPQIEPSLNDYLHQYLRHSYRFNVSHLNSYLRCPLCFYYKTILRIPLNKEKSSSFGTAVHRALSVLYLKKPTKDTVLAVFKKALLEERLSQTDTAWCLENGRSVLSGYYDQYFSGIPSGNLSEYNFRSDDLSYDGIPLTGKIDLITPQSSGQVLVTDFKTGNPDNKYQELSADGDYFRQLVFYKLLLDLKNDPQLRFGRGAIDFVEKSKLKNTYLRKEFDITPQDVEKLKTQIKEVYQKILNLDFFQIGADCRDPNHLHYLFSQK